VHSLHVQYIHSSAFRRRNQGVRHGYGHRMASFRVPRSHAPSGMQLQRRSGSLHSPRCTHNVSAAGTHSASLPPMDSGSLCPARVRWRWLCSTMTRRMLRLHSWQRHNAGGCVLTHAWTISQLLLFSSWCAPSPRGLMFCCLRIHQCRVSAYTVALATAAGSHCYTASVRERTL
jgi:hypothetical protein